MNFNILFTLVSAFFIQHSAHADPLTISVTPSRTIFNSEYFASCRALAIKPVVPDRSGPGFVFPNFHLSWTGKELLFVQAIRVTVTDPELSGGRHVEDLSQEEIRALLGLSSNVISAPVTIDTGLRPVNPCGLGVAQIYFDKGSSAQAFVATVRIDLYGTTVTTDGTSESPVLVSATGVAEYVPPQFKSLQAK